MPVDKADPQGQAKAPHKSQHDKQPKVAEPTRYAMSKYVHAESTSPALHERIFGQSEGRLR
jgi:hypothetical protein